MFVELTYGASDGQTVLLNTQHMRRIAARISYGGKIHGTDIHLDYGSGNADSAQDFIWVEEDYLTVRRLVTGR